MAGSCCRPAAVFKARAGPEQVSLRCTDGEGAAAWQWLGAAAAKARAGSEQVSLR